MITDFTTCRRRARGFERLKTNGDTARMRSGCAAMTAKRHGSWRPWREGDRPRRALLFDRPAVTGPARAQNRSLSRSFEMRALFLQLMLTHRNRAILQQHSG
jgi:hypothetical protein